MDLRETGWSGMGWIDATQNGVQSRILVNTVMNLRFSKNVVKLLGSCTIGGLSRRAQPI
jgi:hypothetical protein